MPPVVFFGPMYTSVNVGIMFWSTSKSDGPLKRESRGQTISCKLHNAKPDDGIELRIQVHIL
jgi:hypothetical protein